MVLFTKRRTKEKLEQALEISKKKENDIFEYVAIIEWEVEKLNQESSQAWKNRDNASTKSQQTLTKLK